MKGRERRINIPSLHIGWADETRVRPTDRFLCYSAEGSDSQISKIAYALCYSLSSQAMLWKA